MKRAYGRAYRRLWTANALSAVGTGMTTAALPLLASIHPPSGMVLGIIAAAGLLPGLLLAVPAGLLADRYDRRAVLVTADLLRAVVVAAAALALLIGELPGIVLALITFLIGAGETIFVTASQSAIPAYVADAHLDGANGHLQAADDAGREFIGPPIGSLVFRLATWIPFVADAVSYLVSASLLLRLPPADAAPATATATDGDGDGNERPAHDGPPERATMAPAWRVFRSSPPLQVLAGAMFTLSLCGSAVIALLVLIVTTQLSLDRGWFGPTLTVVAVGATVAGLLAGWVRARVSARVAICGAVALNAASYFALGSTHWWPLAIAALLVWGFAVTMGNITSVGIRQRLIPTEYLGRVMGLFRAALGAGGVVGALGGGALAQFTSVGTVAIAAGLLQLPVVLALAIGLPRGTGDQPAASAATN